MKVSLTVIAGPHKGRDFVFQEHDTFIVGRSNHAHFRFSVKDKYFSRLHFPVEVNPPCCRLVDMESNNGTYVNDRRVTTIDMNDGDTIKGGATILEVAIEVDSDTPEVPPATRDFTTAAPVIAMPSIPRYRIERELGRGGMGVVRCKASSGSGLRRSGRHRTQGKD